MVSQIMKYPYLNVMVAGKKGAGKTVLRNKIMKMTAGTSCADGRTPAKALGGRFLGFPIAFYEADGFTLEGNDLLFHEIDRKIVNQGSTGDPANLVHAIFYCCAYSGTSFEEAEQNFLWDLYNKFRVPIFLVVTRCEQLNRREAAKDPLLSSIHALGLPIAGVYPVLCEPVEHYNKAGNVAYTDMPFGVDALMNDFYDRISSMLPDYVDKLKREELELKKKKAEKRVWSYAAGNFAAAACTPPIVDVVALCGVETLMLGHIVDIMYAGVEQGKKEKDRNRMAKLVNPLLGTVAGTLAFNEAIKLIGEFGAVLSAGASAVAAHVAGGLIASAITIAMGRVFISITEQILLGKIQAENLDADDYSKLLKENYKQARKEMKHDGHFSKENFGKDSEAAG